MKQLRRNLYRGIRTRRRILAESLEDRRVLAATVPLIESFEVADLSALTDWTFATTGAGTVDIDTATATQSGTNSLRFDVSSDFVNSTSSATLELDLSSVAGATDLTFDFWIRRLNSSTAIGWFMDVEASGDGTNWTALSSELRPTANTWVNYRYDLDEQLGGAGILLDADVFLRFRQSAFHSIHEAVIDDVRIGQFGDVIGPKVSSISPDSLVAGPVASVDVSFSEAIDATTFTRDDVVVYGADGLQISLATDPIDSGDQTNFRLDFEAQTLRGDYLIEIGPNVNDVAGNPMNQDDDALNGEPADDGFVGNFEIGPSTAETLPIAEGFEVTDLSLLDGWSFHTDQPGSIALDSRFYSGAQSLSLTSRAGNLQSAELLLDLSLQSGATDLSLDFFGMRGDAVYGSTVWVSASNDGATWVDFGTTFSTTFAQWNNYFYDLDAELDAASIVRDSDVYLRLNHTGNIRAFARIDDFRIAARDADGPHIVSITPSSVVPAPLSQFQITFSEPIGVASFTADDIQLVDVSGNEVLLAGDPVDSGDQMTFTVNLSDPQTALSNYSLAIPTEITDLAGNALNQDQDQINGEADDDSFQSEFVLGPPTAQVFPYFQDFEVDGLDALPGWSFEGHVSSPIDLASDQGPFSGEKHLIFDANSSGFSQSPHATLLLDLSSQSSATDLTFDFRIKRLHEHLGNNVELSASGDGITFVEFGTQIRSVVGDYVNYFYDLDQTLANVSIDIDSDVYLRFTKVGSRPVTIDDVRISNRDPVGPSVVGMTPTGTTASPVTDVEINFNEPIETSTFTGHDIVIEPPLFQLPVTVPGVPVDSGNQQLFTAAFDAPQTQPGLYRVLVGPHVEDPDGNSMNQDGDNANDESLDDRFVGTFSIDPVPTAFPYFQGFDDPTEPGENWYFESRDGGSIEFFESLERNELRLRNTPSIVGLNEAILSIDLAGQSGVRVQLDERNSRDPNTEDDGIFVSNDGGATWFTAAPGLDRSNDWITRVIDLDAAIALAGIKYTSDFLIKIRQFGSDIFPFDGLGRQYDNLFVESGVPITVALNVTETVEGTSDAVTLTVTREGDLTDPLEFALTSSDESEASVPMTATIPAGLASVDVPVTIVNDVEVDGPQSLQLFAASSGLVPRPVDLTVFDDEPATFTLLVDSPVINEGTGPDAATVTVRRNVDLDSDLVVSLVSDDETELLVPPTVTIPAGDLEASFEVSTQNDFLIDGTQAASIIASATDWTSGSVAIDVEDDDTATRKTIGGRLEGTLPSDTYEVLFDVVVLADTTLTIDPGTTLQFDTASRLNVGGTVLAQGQPGNEIVLTSLASPPAPGDWIGVDFKATSQARSIFEHTDISYAETGIEIERVNNPQFTVRWSEVHQNEDNGVQVRAGSRQFIDSLDVIIQENRIHHNGGNGVLVAANGVSNSTGTGTRSSPTIVANEIDNNGAAGITVGASYSAFGGLAASVGANPVVSKNYVHDNDVGIRASASEQVGAFGSSGTSGRYTNNIVTDNTNHGFQLTQSGDGTNWSEVVNNTIANNGGSGVSHSSVRFFGLIRNNNLVGNANGIEATEAFTPTAGQVGFNNVFDSSGDNWVNYPAAFGSATTTNANSTPSDAEFNLSVDPMFETGTLFEMEDASAANDAGTDDDAAFDDYNGAFRHIPYDIGAYEHDPVNNVVTTLLDEDDGGLGLGAGNSLREVLTATNARPNADTITFDQSLTGGTIVLGGTALPEISRSTTIVGPGASSLTVSGNDQSPIFIANSGTTVDISGLTIRNALGNGISNRSSLTVSDTVITSNIAGSGGGIFNAGTLHVIRSTISENTATSNGGGIYNSGIATVVDSTIDGNQSENEGGGIYVFNGSGSNLTLINSTVSGNQATLNGGRIANRGTPMLIRNSTIVENIADSDNSGSGTAGGIDGNATLHNTIIAGNFRGTTAPDEADSLDAASSFNLIGDATTSGGLTHGTNGNLVGVDPMLAPLGNYGGATRTHALLNDSPAIDAGNNTEAIGDADAALDNDQRGDGFPRIIDGDRSGLATVDIGAFETRPPAIVEQILVNDGQAQRSIVERVQILFDQPVVLDTEGGSPIELINLNTNQPVNVEFSPGTDSLRPSSHIVLTFLPGSSVGPGGLLDGNYRLTLKADRIAAGVLPLDGDANGSGGDDYHYGEPADNFFRLFGDSDGDRDVDGQDYGRFAASFQLSEGQPGFNPVFDSDKDGDVDGQDYGRFGSNFQIVI
ncbi:MAG: choice-of-anchor Q domain-containing protein [Planctomycetota bacterium]